MARNLVKVFSSLRTLTTSTSSAVSRGILLLHLVKFIWARIWIMAKQLYVGTTYDVSHPLLLLATTLSMLWVHLFCFLVTSKYDVKQEIKRRIAFGNGPCRRLSNRDLSCLMKHGAAAWTLLRVHAATLGVFKREFICSIFGTVSLP